jgi:hypothetical protein
MALGLSIPMAARPAQCLVVINGTPLLDGACDFQPGQKGSFEISSGQAGVKATVTVSSEGAGSATYTPAGGKGGPLKIGDVKRDGACWVSRQDKICAWASGSRPDATPASAAPAAAAASKGKLVRPSLYRWDLPKSGNWELARFTRDAAGKQQLFCTAIVMIGTEEGLRLEHNPKEMVYGFMGYGSHSIGATVKLGYWFGNNKAGRVDVTAKLTPSPEDGTEWLSYSQTNESPGDEDAFANTNSVNYAYRLDGKEYIQKFPLTGSNAAFTRLTDCSRNNMGQP